MERFWNIVHYFAYKADIKLTWYFYKYTGVFFLLNLSFMKKRYEKGGIKDPVTHLMDAHKRLDIGLSRLVAFGFILGGNLCVLLGLFMCFPNMQLPIELFTVCSVAIFLFDYILLIHKEKYLKYFKEFDKKPRQWKIKWAWISFGVILFQWSFLLLAGFVLNPLFRL